MHLRPMNLCAPSREGSFTGTQMAVAGREGSFDAARVLAALRQQPAAAVTTAAPQQLLLRPPSLRQPQPQPQPQPPKPTSPERERERLAFLSAALTNPTIATDAAAVAVAALAVAGPSPAPAPSPSPSPKQPQPQPQQQQQHQNPAPTAATTTATAAAAALPMSPFYAQRSQLQQSAVAVASQYVFRAAAQHVRFSSSSPTTTTATALPPVVRVAEIGCAAASNTKLPVQALLAGLAARAHRARREAAGGRARTERAALLQQKRSSTAAAAATATTTSAAVPGTSPPPPPPVFLTAAGDAGADEDDTAAGDAAAAFPLPAQVDLRLVDLPTNDWAAVALAAGRMTAELAQQAAGAAIDAAAANDADQDEDALVTSDDADDDGNSVVSAVGPDFDDDALAAGGPRLPPAPPASVFATAAPVSMYDPCGVAPTASQHLIYSNTCASWQPGQHARVPAGSSASGFVSLTKTLRAQAGELAARDGGALHAALEGWRLGARGALGRWLRLRAGELADGGVLVFTIPCADEEGEGGAEDEEDEPNSFATWMAPLVGGAVRDLLREGAITPDEAEVLTVPVCALPTEDLREVLGGVVALAAKDGASSSSSSSSPPPTLFEVVEMAKEVLPPHPAWFHYRTGAITPLALGHAYSEWVAALCEPFFVAQLAPKLAARGVAPLGPAAREAAGALAARLFRRVAERVARDPRPLRYLPVVVTLRRLPREAAAAAV